MFFFLFIIIIRYWYPNTYIGFVPPFLLLLLARSLALSLSSFIFLVFNTALLLRLSRLFYFCFFSLTHFLYINAFIICEKL